MQIWIWADLGWSRPHACRMWGWRWAPDTPEYRRLHPDGHAGTAQDAYGWSATGNYRPVRSAS